MPEMIPALIFACKLNADTVMNILIFEKSPVIRKQIERNILGIINGVDIHTVSTLENFFNEIADFNYNLVIADGDNLENKFKSLVEIIKNKNPKAYIILLFSFNIQSFYDKFLNNGADFCYDKHSGFDDFISVIESIYKESTQDQGEIGLFHKVI
jgi:DNA-binding NarL/FixJ family response regulator